MLHKQFYLIIIDRYIKEENKSQWI